MGLERHLLYPGEARKVALSPVDPSAETAMSGAARNAPARWWLTMLLLLVLARVIYELSPEA